jgi:hypothetical protein
VRPDPTESSAELSALDRAHLERMLRRERVFGFLMAANLAAAALLTVIWTVRGSWTPTRAVVIVLVLLAARANLRQGRSARLLRKLAPTIDR